VSTKSYRMDLSNVRHVTLGILGSMASASKVGAPNSRFISAVEGMEGKIQLEKRKCDHSLSPRAMGVLGVK
jgi:hypothetical protein